MPEYWVLSGLVLAASFFLFSRAAGTMDLRRLNLISWMFYVGLFTEVFVGIHLAFLLDIKNANLARASDEGLEMAYWAILYAMLAVPTAMIAVQFLVFGGNIRRRLLAYYRAPLRPMQSPRDSGPVFFWVFLTLLSVAATAYTYALLQKVAWYELLFGGGFDSYLEARYAARRGFEGFVYVRNIFTELLGPLVAYVAYGYWRLYRRPLYLLWFALAFANALLAVNYYGAKAPTIILLATLVFTHGIIKGRFRFGLLAGLFTVTVAIIFVTYALVAPSFAITLRSGPLGRIFLGWLAGLPLSFDVFPRVHPFLNGSSLPGWMAALWGGEHLRSGTILLQVYHRSEMEAGTAVFMNSLFMAEAWANWGWIGFYLSPLVVGALAQTAFNILLLLPKSPPLVALMAYFFFGMSFTLGFVQFVWNATWIALVILIVAGWYFREALGRPLRSLVRRAAGGRA